MEDCSRNGGHRGRFVSHVEKVAMENEGVASMNHESSWVQHNINQISTRVSNMLPFTSEDESKPPISISSVLPDDMLEKILSCVPLATLFRLASVCKKWHEIVKSRRFQCNFSASTIWQKPWYYMFTSGEAAGGYTYDPTLRKWYSGIHLPCIEASNWFISSSCGLVCFMDSESRTRIYVCNPITKRWRGLEVPSGEACSDYSSLAIHVDRGSTHSYQVAVTKSKQVGDDFLQCEFSIVIYNSEARSWVSPVREVFSQWRGGCESVICNGKLYCLIVSVGVVGHAELRHRLIVFDVSSTQCSSYSSLLANSIQVPCPLTCGRLMNLKDKLVMVGGIGKQDRMDIIKGIGIWVLDDKTEWIEVGRMPHKFFQGFGELDDVFASSGSADLIYIQSFGAPTLLVFDMTQKQWKWSQKCPVAKRFPLQLFNGFCFEPRLDVFP